MRITTVAVDASRNQMKFDILKRAFANIYNVLSRSGKDHQSL